MEVLDALPDVLGIDVRDHLEARLAGGELDRCAADDTASIAAWLNLAQRSPALCHDRMVVPLAWKGVDRDEVAYLDLTERSGTLREVLGEPRTRSVEPPRLSADDGGEVDARRSRQARWGAGDGQNVPGQGGRIKGDGTR